MPWRPRSVDIVRSNRSSRPVQWMAAMCCERVDACSSACRFGRTTTRCGSSQAILVPLGYAVDDIPVERCLHLKSAATAAADDLLVLNPAWIDPARFGGIEWVAIDPGEPSGANVVRVRDTVVCPTSAPRTRERLEARGLTVRAVDASELAKAEGALTCCSLIFSQSAVTR